MGEEVAVAGHLTHHGRVLRRRSVERYGHDPASDLAVHVLLADAVDFAAVRGQDRVGIAKPARLGRLDDIANGSDPNSINSRCLRTTCTLVGGDS